MSEVDIVHLRNHFSILVIGSEVQTTQALAETIKASGYEDVRFCPTLDLALSMARQSPPHMVLLDLEKFEETAGGFLVDLQTISSEILVLLQTSAKQSFAALQLINRGLAYDSFPKQFVSTLEIVQAMDRAGGRLYYQFAFEQLRDLNGEPDDSTPKTPPAKKEMGFDKLNQFISRLQGTKDLDQTIQVFLDVLTHALGDKPLLYLKYVPGHMSLLVAHARQIQVDKIRGVGIDFKKESWGRLMEFFQAPAQSEPLRAFIKQVFQHDRFTVFTHTHEAEFIGVFVILDEVDLDSAQSEVGCLRGVFDMAYKRNLALKEKHLLDTIDLPTGLHNRKAFGQKLDEEISRSRRLYMPVSIVVIDIDGIHKLNERLGFQQTDAVLKTVAMILKKTARANDIIARTGPDEFVCLLPHTGHQGASIKAERVRRIIESTRIPLLEQMGLGPLTVSCGVSEYPSFAADAESLVRSADEALMHVRRAGGNKVCLSVAPRGFQADFVPREPLREESR